LFTIKALKPLCTVQRNRAKYQQPCKPPERHQKQKPPHTFVYKAHGFVNNFFERFFVQPF
jgi:hypothetical protein